jgi:hypothetical protein
MTMTADGLWICPSCSLKQRIIAGQWQCRVCEYGALDAAEEIARRERVDAARSLFDAADLSKAMSKMSNDELRQTVLDSMDGLAPDSPLYHLLGELEIRVRVLETFRESCPLIEYSQAMVAARLGLEDGDK